MGFAMALRAAVATTAVAGCLGLPAPSAVAQPAGFPDLNAFTEAPAGQNFSRPDRWANGYAFFTTPDGISCAIGTTKWCSGPLPGLPPDEHSACTFVVQKNDVSQAFRFEPSDKPCAAANDTVLAAGQKLTLPVYDTTCVVGADRLTACIDTARQHGFVLEPSGSWTF